jgi:dTDP-glucose 4,6-dehydratase
VRRIVAILGVPVSLITHVTDRPAHDRRYAMDARRARQALGWTPRWGLEDGLAATVRWYAAHEAWWRAVKDGSYRQFYHTWYGERTA